MEAAFFDLDKTVIAKASLVAFGRPLLDAGFINRRLLLRALWSNLIFHWLGADEERMRQFRESALRITRGWDQARISALVHDNLTEVIEPIVYDEALDLIRAHQAAGREVYLISASPIEIVAPLGTFLRVDGVIASRARIDDAGRYTGEVDYYSYGPYKAEAMRDLAAERGIDLDASFAYSDSATDVPMLEAVGHPVAVNPDKDLRRVARANGWEVRTFEHGVPLGERVPLPTRARAAAVVGGVLALGAVAGVVAWRRGLRPPRWVARSGARVSAPTATPLDRVRRWKATLPGRRPDAGDLGRPAPGRAPARLRPVEDGRAGRSSLVRGGAGTNPVTASIRRRPAAS